MNNLCKLVGIVLITMSALACTEDASYTAGVWNRRSDFDGLARNDAAGFTIGNKGYISGGYRGSKYSRLNDCWEYDIVNDYWTQCADMPVLPVMRQSDSRLAKKVISQPDTTVRPMVT
ncbi:gll3207 protein [Bacteroides reticulotermitis JCM 10512]|uniref:Gll3207 protein n=1 Tax=Bacteroides reticulotermitis JCM 10512 TaxID=1445607 RepID=W4US17_9BACE|nr:gll3207 protein [Bacteroides reticulotermitis JCM 10512]